VVELAPDDCSLFFKKEMELSLIGLQNAGKTSLVNVLTTGAFHEDMIPTVGFNMRKVTKGAVTIKLWDLGGQVKYTSKVCCKIITPLSAAPVALRECHSDCPSLICCSLVSEACGRGTAGEFKLLYTLWTQQIMMVWTQGDRSCMSCCKNPL